MIKIGVFVPDLGGGGAEKVMSNFLNYIDQEYGHNVKAYLIVNEFKGPNCNKIPNNVDIIELNCSNIILSFYSLSKIIKEIGIDFLFSTVRGANISVALSRFLFNDYIWVLREANTFSNPNYTQTFKERVINALCYLLYHKSDRILANSPDTMNDIIGKCKFIDEENIKFLPNPVISQNEMPISSSCINNAGITKIISVGRLVPQKNFDYLFLAVRYVIDRGYKVEVDIYGEGYLNHSLKEKIKQLKLDGVINIKPFEPDIVNKYYMYDIFISSSKWEGFGNVFVEAMSAGVPIISTRCPGGPSFIFPEDSPLINLVPLDDYEKFGDTIIRRINTECSDSDISNIIEFSKKYSVEKVCDDYFSFLTNLK